MALDMNEPRWLSPEERSAWLAVAALMAQLPAALDTQLQADEQLSFFEYMVMAALSEQADRTMQMSVIAAVTSSSLSRLSHTAKRLEDQGFLRRERVAGPGRPTNAVLTDRGFAKVVAAAPGHVGQVRRLLIDNLDPAQLEALRQIGHLFLDRIEPDSDGVRVAALRSFREPGS